MTSTLAESSQHAKVHEAIGESEPFLQFQEEISRAAKVDRPLLIIGERGTGKELAAGRLHYLSRRWNEPLVALNCSALAPSLIESELFGYEAGAFTGAQRQRKGRFEAADLGTLFLDEIGNIPLEVQSKILRVVEYQSFERVGGFEPVQVDVRIIGATNADLPAMAAEGRFKSDLLDRLAFEVLVVPPLRERSGDIRLLAAHFAARMAHDLSWPKLPVLADEALAALEDYDWPGNVRELKNVVERAVFRSDNHVVREVVFNPFPRNLPRENTVELARPGESPSAPDGRAISTGPEETFSFDRPFKEQVLDFESGLLTAALEKTQFNQKKAARLLGLSYNQFRGLYRKHNLAD